jgi:tripartite-type tricarboxylate transporter receptor subunit TctC
MHMRLAKLARLAVATGCMALGAGPALPETPFYQGKRPTIFVNFAAGGPTDVEARLFARSIARHLPGSPSLLVRNMDGAGGMTGANYLGEVAPRDGSVIGYFSSVAWLHSILPGERRVAFDSYDFVAYQPGTSVHYMRTDVRPGIRSVDQIRSAQNLVVGGLSRDNAKDVMMRLTLDMLGVSYKYVTAYPGSQGARLAFQRGEISLYSESPAVYRSLIQPLVQKDEAIPLYYDPGWDGQAFSVPKQMEGLAIPSFAEVYRRLMASEPSGIAWEAYRAVLSINNALQRLVVLPPQSPPAAIEALRAAIRAMQRDPLYAEEATRAFGYVPEYVTEADTNERVRRLLRVAPDVTAFVRRLIAGP